MRLSAAHLWLLSAALASAAPPPLADDSPADLVRVEGPAELRPLAERWRARFREAHPAIRVELRLEGSDVAMAALYCHRAEVALLGREATAAEVKAFEWIHRYRPTAVEVATGSLGVAGRSAALVVLVHPDNPIAALSLRQLDALFSRERRRGAPDALRTWGDLGLGGAWRDRPVSLHAPDTESGVGRFFRRAVLDDSRLLAWDRLREYADPPGTHDAGAAIVAALAGDPGGLAVAPASPAAARVKAIPVAVGTGDPVGATPATVASRAYPLTRAVLAYVNRAPGAALSTATATFLAFLLSPGGQAAIAEEGVNHPLPEAVLLLQRAQLGPGP